MLSGAWEALLAAPLDAREQAAGNKIAALEQRLGTLNESITTTADGMNESLPGSLDRLRALHDRVAKGDEEMKLLTSDLVDPAQMRSVLEELLQRQSGLRLISATNLEPRPLLEDAATPADEPGDAAARSGRAEALPPHVRAAPRG